MSYNKMSVDEYQRLYAENERAKSQAVESPPTRGQGMKSPLMEATEEIIGLRARIRTLEAENQRLREELDDGNRAYRDVMAEACAGGVTYETDDRLHCTCVPHLREGVKALTARIRDLEAERTLAVKARDNWREAHDQVQARTLTAENERLRKEIEDIGWHRVYYNDAVSRAEHAEAEAASLHAENERLRAELEGAKRFGDIQLAEKRALEAALVTLMVAPTNRENADTSREYNSAWAAASDVLGRNPFEYRAALTEPTPPQEEPR